MLKTWIKVIIVAVALIFIPSFILGILYVLGTVLPLIGVMLVLFLPIVLIGVTIGYLNGKKKG